MKMGRKIHNSFVWRHFQKVLITRRFLDIRYMRHCGYSVGQFWCVLERQQILLQVKDTGGFQKLEGHRVSG